MVNEGGLQVSCETLGSELRGTVLRKVKGRKQSLVIKWFCAIISCLYELVLKQSACLFLPHSVLRVFVA